MSGQGLSAEERAILLDPSEHDLIRALVAEVRRLREAA